MSMWMDPFLFIPAVGPCDFSVRELVGALLNMGRYGLSPVRASFFFFAEIRAPMYLALCYLLSDIVLDFLRVHDFESVLRE